MDLTDFHRIISENLLNLNHPWSILFLGRPIWAIYNQNNYFLNTIIF